MTALVEPLKREIANGWERAFKTRMPDLLRDKLVDPAQSLIQGFHEAISTRSNLQHSRQFGLAVLAQQIKSHQQMIVDLAFTAESNIMGRAKTAHRELITELRRGMNPVYTHCNEESGK